VPAAVTALPATRRQGSGPGWELLVLHDAFRAAAVPADSPTPNGDTGAEATADILPPVAVTASVSVAAVTITWANDTGHHRSPTRDARAVSQRPPPLTGRAGYGAVHG
jgi:hypothetical protein